MHKHLAILIVGKPNSGKTTTLKHFCNKYDHKAVSTFKQGWRYAITPFKENYYGVKIISYFLPSSRTEKRESLESIFNELEWYPDFLFMAEQLNGAEYKNTVEFLRKKNYKIVEFRLDNSNLDTIWHYYNSKDEDMILGYRTEAIADTVREFILSRI